MKREGPGSSPGEWTNAESAGRTWKEASLAQKKWSKAMNTTK